MKTIGKRLPNLQAYLQLSIRRGITNIPKIKSKCRGKSR